MWVWKSHKDTRNDRVTSDAESLCKERSLFSFTFTLGQSPVEIMQKNSVGDIGIWPRMLKESLFGVFYAILLFHFICQRNEFVCLNGYCDSTLFGQQYTHVCEQSKTETDEINMAVARAVKHTAIMQEVATIVPSLSHKRHKGEAGASLE
tara:strand:+ start:4248 stop:4697 length:450 start_codon:yes stop_codon:yes gene_type:complete